MNTNKNLLACVTINPPQQPKASMIWLHGLGAEGNDFTPILPALHPQITQQVRFIFPDAPIIPVSINGGYAMRAWFDITHSSLDIQIDENGIQRSVAQVFDLIEHEISKGIPAEKIILGGFSQGAVIAITAGLSCTYSLAGAIGLSGFLPNASALIEQSQQKTLPIFIAHGTQDHVVPFQLGLQTQALLSHANYPVTWHQYPIAHNVCAEEIADIDEWIRNRLTLD